MKESPFIEHIMVVGENRNYAAALIIPNFEHLRNWCEVKNIEFVSKSQAVQNPAIIRRIRRDVERFNQDLGQTEKIKKIRLLDAEWTTDSGEISPTLKLRRKFIIEKYARIIEETYRSSEFNYRVE
jgi:long-chain acyl-CoA synthetase